MGDLTVFLLYIVSYPTFWMDKNRIFILDFIGNKVSASKKPVFNGILQVHRLFPIESIIRNFLRDKIANIKFIQHDGLKTPGFGGISIKIGISRNRNAGYPLVRRCLFDRKKRGFPLGEVYM